MALLDKLQNLNRFYTQTIVLNRVTITLNRIGKITMVGISHDGGVTDSNLPEGTVLSSLRPHSAVYLGVPSESGSPYIFINSRGLVHIRSNGGKFQPATSSTSYFLQQVYVSEI